MRTEEANAAAGVGARNGAESTARQRTGTQSRASASAAQSSNRYVKTKDAQWAVQDREAEIVQALGIPWREGQRNHIRCPYPDHGGADDWRLTSKGRAICTCTGGKTDSVFDIAGKVEGLDFEAAKIRCVEIVGRTDLIRTKTEGGGNYQTTDARGLLNAPADRRDDTLARAYLAHRLGIEPAAVMMPSTAVVGLKELAYFDPPKTPKGKPAKVGEWPCIVFGQIDVQGNRAAFARQGAADTRAMLFGAGLRTENDGEHIAVKCVKAADPAREIIVVRRPGWHNSDSGAPFFVCPSGQIFGAQGDDRPELSVNTKISPTVASGGTMEGWRQAVTAACTAPHCEHWTLGTIAGFAAPVLSLCGLDSCGINLSGMTSGGKTTAQRLAVSAWSRAALDQRESLLQSARATANGIELMAARSNGTVLALDELGHVHGKELGRIIYSLASGVGKTRMSAEAQLRSDRIDAAERLARLPLSAKAGDGMPQRYIERVRCPSVTWTIGAAVFGKMPGSDRRLPVRSVSTSNRRRISSWLFVRL